MTNNILIILHHSSGSAGKIQTKLIERGYNLDIRCIVDGDLLPNPHNYCAVIILGGVMSVNDFETINGIHKEIQWIPSVIKANIPYLGICLGAQLLSHALGGEVNKKQCETVEIGYHPIKTVNTNDFKYFPKKEYAFYQWHLEGFSIPKGCELLAKSKHFPNQAFKLIKNDKIIGLQFHPEATKEMIDRWIKREPQKLSLLGAQDHETQIKHHLKYDKEVDIWLDSFLDNWLTSA